MLDLAFLGLQVADPGKLSSLLKNLLLFLLLLLSLLALAILTLTPLQLLNNVLDGLTAALLVEVPELLAALPQLLLLIVHGACSPHPPWSISLSMLGVSAARKPEAPTYSPRLQQML